LKIAFSEIERETQTICLVKMHTAKTLFYEYLNTVQFLRKTFNANVRRIPEGLSNDIHFDFNQLKGQRLGIDEIK
jgi:hypothetical protein